MRGQSVQQDRQCLKNHRVTLWRTSPVAVVHKKNIPSCESADQALQNPARPPFAGVVWTPRPGGKLQIKSGKNRV